MANHAPMRVLYPDKALRRKFYELRQEKQRHVDAFWIAFKNANDQPTKLDLLRGMADKVFGRPGAWNAEKRRRFEQIKNKYYQLEGPCKVCGRPSEVRHHIIQLRNGGSNHGSNVIRLCKDCHSEIHPWLRR